MSGPDECVHTQRGKFRYWSLYTMSVFFLVIPTLLITLGLTGICSVVFDNPESNYLLPSAFVASIAVCSMDLVSDGELDGKIDFKKKEKE